MAPIKNTTADISSPVPCAFGEVLFDCFPDGSCCLGGAPFNVACHLDAFQQKPVFISGIGNDQKGTDIIRRMREKGMSTERVQRSSGYPTGQVLVEVEDGEPHYDILTNQAYDTARMPQELLNASIFYHGSLALRTEEACSSVMEWRQRSDAPVFMDVNLRTGCYRKEVIDLALRNIDYLKLNHFEFYELKKLLGHHMDTPVKVFMHAYSIKNVLLTKGAEGSEYYSHDGQYYSKPACNVGHIVDTVGAGDAFSAAFIYGLLKGERVQNILTNASRFSAHICGIKGALPSDSSIYREFLL